MKPILFLLLSLLPVCAFGQDHFLFPIKNEKGKFGFIDKTGSEIVKPQFEDVGVFAEGLVAVKLGAKWGFIDHTGKIVIEPRWDYSVEPTIPYYFDLNRELTFRDGIAIVSIGKGENSRCGYIDKKGAYLIAPENFIDCSQFSDGLAMVKIKTSPDPQCPECNCGFIDKSGEWVIPPRFVVESLKEYPGSSAPEMANRFKDGHAFVSTGERGDDRNLKYFLIDKTGRSATVKNDCRWKYHFSEGFAKVSRPELYNGEQYKNYFINEKCERIDLAPDVFVTSDFHEGVAAAVKRGDPIEGRFGFINTAGKAVIPFMFWNADAFNDGLAIVSRKYGYSYYIDHQGQPAFKAESSFWNNDELLFNWTWKSAAQPFVNGLAHQMLDTHPLPSKEHQKFQFEGYMNKQGRYVWIAPQAKSLLSEKWMKQHYVGTQKFD